MATLNAARADAAFVEADGEVVGTISDADLTTTLQVRREAGAVVSPRTAM